MLMSHEGADRAPEIDHGVKGGNFLRESLKNGRFFVTLEYIPSSKKSLLEDIDANKEISAEIRTSDLIAGYAVTDRVVSDSDPDPTITAAHFRLCTGKQPLVHLSGKGREIKDFEKSLRNIADSGLENVLILTGDRLHDEPTNFRPRYLESVSAIKIARAFDPTLTICAAFNPFKYREEDAMAQYLKLSKKVKAGADVLITQVGFDVQKLEELPAYIEAEREKVRLIANFMPLTAPRARYIRKNKLAGVVISDSLLGLLEEDERTSPDKGLAKAYERLALQIVGAKLLGYAGVQITGVHALHRLKQILDLVDVLEERISDYASWKRSWNAAYTLRDGEVVDFSPCENPWYFSSGTNVSASMHERLKYSLMERVHHVLFEKGLVAGLFGAAVKNVKRRSRPGRLLSALEETVKNPVVGCETCGMCRLAATQYVCPETCPKGLANGPCGGTAENVCEFGDRECIHSRKYRIAKSSGRLNDLKELIIPAVPGELRGTSSWPAHFRGEAPPVLYGSDNGSGRNR